VTGTVGNGDCVSVSASDDRNGIFGASEQEFPEFPEFWSGINNLVNNTQKIQLFVYSPFAVPIKWGDIATSL
jgi:hypothetical protein